jgi:putative two-component system response regulator
VNRELDGAQPTGDAIAELRILVVDDEPANTILLQGMLRRWGFTNVVAITDPTRVVDAFTQAVPDLLLLDIGMPGLSGFDVMGLLADWLGSDTPVPVVVLTADVTDATKHRALECGARDFLTKPFDPEEVRLRVSNLLELRLLQLKIKRHNDDLEERVERRTHQLELSRLELVHRLAAAAEDRDDDPPRHAHRIGRTAGLLAAGLGLASGAAERIRLAAPLHDIGKIAIPDTILLKPGKLTLDEFATMRSHTVVGARILAGSSSHLLRTASEIALTHHERWDGGGYPGGLVGAATPLAGRVVAVADVFDALAHRRPYKQPWPVDDAVAEILSQAGRHFDPDVVAAFAGLDHHALVEGEQTESAPMLAAHRGTGLQTAV